jgi:hypothetical protein
MGRNNHFGKSSRSGYHNKEWAARMLRVGLIPSNTGKPGGKETGQHMTHYIAPEAAFQTAFTDLEADGFDDLYVELWNDEASRAKRKKKADSKTRYTCSSCSLHAWAKPGARFMCGQCEILMEATDDENTSAV